MTWPLDPASPPMTAPTPSGGGASPCCPDCGSELRHVDGEDWACARCKDPQTQSGQRYWRVVMPNAAEKLAIENAELRAALLAARRENETQAIRLTMLQDAKDQQSAISLGLMQDCERLEATISAMAADIIIAYDRGKAALAATPEEK